jgi:glutamate synthase domain-containing protein 3
MVTLTEVGDEQEANFLQGMVSMHLELTKSRLADEILADWDQNITKFIRIIPKDYLRVIELQQQMLDIGLSPHDAEMAAFEKAVAA